MKLSLQQQSTTVEVVAATLTLDTTTEIQTTLVTGTDRNLASQNAVFVAVKRDHRSPPSLTSY